MENQKNKGKQRRDFFQMDIHHMRPDRVHFLQQWGTGFIRWFYEPFCRFYGLQSSCYDISGQDSWKGTQSIRLYRLSWCRGGICPSVLYRRNQFWDVHILFTHHCFLWNKIWHKLHVETELIQRGAVFVILHCGCRSPALAIQQPETDHERCVPDFLRLWC